MKEKKEGNAVHDTTMKFKNQNARLLMYFFVFCFFAQERKKEIEKREWQYVDVMVDECGTVRTMKMMK